MRHRTALIGVLALLPALAVFQQSSWGASSSTNVFTQRNCARCHSTGDGARAVGGPPVSSMEIDGSLLDFGARLWNHGPAMVKQATSLNIAVPRLEARDVPAIFSYLVSAGSHKKEQSAAAGDAARGEIAWKGLKCAGCHSLEPGQQKVGSSLSAYKSLSPVQMVQAMWKHSPEMAKAMSENGVNVPRLTGSQMVDILAYIRSRTGMKDSVIFTELGDPFRGAEVFQKKKCVSCHPVADSATQYGPQLERRKEFAEGTAGIAALMWNHAVGMRDDMMKAGLAVPSFEGTEMADLLSYLYISTYSEQPGDPILGKKLFELKKCLSCHVSGGSAEKTTRAGTLAAFSIVASMWNHVASMSDNAAAVPVIKPGEMRDLVAYLESTKPSH